MTIQSQIEQKLRAELKPVHLEVINESHMHSVPPNSETHFKVVAVAEAFASSTLVRRHQKIYGVLAEELAGGVHALALHTYTPGEWAEKQQAPDSPTCLGGGKHDQ